jgi:hypothetical protein
MIIFPYLSFLTTFGRKYHYFSKMLTQIWSNNNKKYLF